MIGQDDLVRQRFSAEAGAWNGHYRAEDGSIYTANLLCRRKVALAFASGVRGRVLDLGCGSGNVVLAMTDRQGVAAVGADLSIGMLKRARENARRQRQALPLVNAEAARLPFAAGAFQAVFCLGLLDYLQAHLPMLRECRRVLAPGGTLIVSVPNARSPFVRADDLGFGIKNALTRSLPAGLRAWIKRELLGKTDAAYYGYRKHRYNPDAFAQQLERLGFSVNQRTYRTYGFAMLDRTAANRRLSEILDTRASRSRTTERTGWTHILSATRLPRRSP